MESSIFCCFFLFHVERTFAANTVPKLLIAWSDFGFVDNFAVVLSLIEDNAANSRNSKIKL